MSELVGSTGSKSGVVGQVSQNIVMALDKGIDFGANANASEMSAEVFNDYEQGTFTITHGTHSISSEYGYYVRMTKICSIMIQMNFNVDSRTSSAAFSTLPFTAHSIDGQGGACWPNSIALFGSCTFAALRIAPSSNTFTFYCTGDDVGVNNTITTNNGSTMHATGQYIVA